jgi:hypothetical protein
MVNAKFWTTEPQCASILVWISTVPHYIIDQSFMVCCAKRKRLLVCMEVLVETMRHILSYEVGK